MRSDSTQSTMQASRACLELFESRFEAPCMQKELVLPFALAVAVVGGALWMLGGPLSHGVKDSSRETASSLSLQQSKPALKELRDKVLPHQPEVATQDSTNEPGRIHKCVLNGNTIYSDAKCPTGAVVQKVELHDTAGIVSPPKAVLGELTAQRKAAELAAEREREALQTAARAAPSHKDECQWLEKQIAYLDSLARQPQSGQTQDRIRAERAAARNRQFALHC